MTGKNTKGTPSLESYQGRLRIRFRANGQQKTFSLGLADADENRVKGESIARQMQLDMLSDNFDSTLGKYKPHTHLTIVEAIKPKQALDLGELWHLYLEFKISELTKSSMTCFNAISSHIKKLPSKSLDNAETIQAYFKRMKPDTAKKYLININACCKWGLKRKLISVNPFDGMASEIPVKHSTKNSQKAFTAEERDTIINAFKTDTLYSH